MATNSQREGVELERALFIDLLSLGCVAKAELSEVAWTAGKGCAHMMLHYDGLSANPQLGTKSSWMFSKIHLCRLRCATVNQALIQATAIATDL